MSVVVAESQPQVRFALRVMLEQRPDARIVGEASDDSSLLALVREVHPDLVLLGWGSPGLGDRDLPERLLRTQPGIWLIVLSERQELGHAALSAGARAFVSKGNPPDELLAALDECVRERAHRTDAV